MNVGAVGAVGHGGAVYALSPYLSGTVRTPDAGAASERTTAAATATVVVTNTTTTAEATAPPPAPYLNPAISDIAARAAITPAAGTAIVATLSGDSGLLIQSYGAVALVAAPLALAPIATPPAPLAIPPVAAIPATQRPSLRPNGDSTT